MRLVQLQGAIIDNVVLKRTRLGNTNLNNVDFSKAKEITETDFNLADLSGAKFCPPGSQKNLHAVDFSDAILIKTDFSYCRIVNPFFVNAIFEGTNFNFTTLVDAKFQNRDGSA